MNVLVAVPELVAEFDGAAVELFRPPSTNIRDGVEGFLRSPVHREAGGETVITHDSSRFAVCGVEFVGARELMAGLTD
ncbi:MAG: hypothetical protein ACRDQD_22355 [Nocardioidaceae bacterium]